MTLETGLVTGTDLSAFSAAESWLGSPVQFLSWSTGKASWADWQGSIGSSVNKLSAVGTPVHWTIPLFAQGGNLAAAADHDYDSYYIAAAKQLAASTPGDEKIVVRVGEEFNGSWMPWAASGQEADFAQAYRNFVDAFRSVSDKFQFEWNVAVGSNGTNAAAAYPGDAYVDYISGDLYWDTKETWSITNPASAFSYYANTSYGLNWLASFASSHDKPVALDEWGVNSDNAGPFIQDVYNWLVSNNAAFESYWDNNSVFSGQLSNNQYPDVSAIFKSLFGVNLITDGMAVAANNIALGTDGNDIFTLADGNYMVGGGGGADAITVGNGNSHIYGNLATAAAGSVDGADTIIAGGGSNYINGNAGNDTITVGSSGTTGANRIYGGQGDDTITIHGAGMNSANGNLGNDTIDASDATGNNLLRGGQGNDILYAGHGHDVLMGDAGDDTLHAGTGAGHVTVMTGGTGADLFDFSAAGAGIRAVIAGATFYQEVTDYTVGTDHLALGFGVAVGHILGQDHAAFADMASAESYAAQLLAGHSDDVAALQVGNDTLLVWSAGGTADSAVKLDAVSAHSLTVTDFM